MAYTSDDAPETPRATTLALVPPAQRNGSTVVAKPSATSSAHAHAAAAANDALVEWRVGYEVSRRRSAA